MSHGPLILFVIIFRLLSFMILFISAVCRTLNEITIQLVAEKNLETEG